VYTYIKIGGSGTGFYKGRYLHTVNYTKARFNNKPVSGTLLDKTQGNIGLLSAVLQVMNYNL